MQNRWLTRAFTGSVSTDFIDPGDGSKGGFLSPQQVMTFLRQAIEGTAILSLARKEYSINPKFEVPRIAMNSRILQPGVQGERVADAKRKKPTTGLMTLSTVLFKGEIPVADEVFEDQVERDRLADTLMVMIAEAVGRDIEEIIIKSDTARDPAGADSGNPDSAIFDQLDGIIKRAQASFPAAQKVNATGITTPEDLFSKAIEALPHRYRRDYGSLRFFVPVPTKDAYHKALAARGTVLGDTMLTSTGGVTLNYRGIPIVEVPLLSGTDTINGSAIDYTKFGFLTDPMNIVVGFQRRIRMERYRDPREGATSFLPTVRFDADWANPEASVLLYNIPTFA